MNTILSFIAPRKPNGKIDKHELALNLGVVFMVIFGLLFIGLLDTID